MTVKPVYYNLQELDRYARYESKGFKPRIGVLNKKYLFVVITVPKLDGYYEMTYVIFWRIVSQLLEKLKFLDFDSAKVELLCEEAGDNRIAVQRQLKEIAENAQARLQKANDDLLEVQKTLSVLWAQLTPPESR